MVSLESSRFTESVPRFLEIKNRSQKKVMTILNPGIQPKDNRYESYDVYKMTETKVDGNSEFWPEKLPKF